MRIPHPQLILFSALLLATQAALAVDYPGPVVREVYKEWMADVDPMASEAERALFAVLESDIQREVFIADFWARRGEAHGQRFHLNRLAAQEARFRSKEQERVAVLTGFPAQRVTYPECGALLRKLEIWRYTPWQIESQSGIGSKTPTSVIFVQAVHGDPRSYRLWSPHDPSDRLSRSARDHGETVERAIATGQERGCLDEDGARLLSENLEESLDLPRIVDLFGWPAPADPPEVETDGESFGIAHLETSFPGRFFDRTVVRLEVGIPVHALSTLDGVHILDSLLLSGDIYKGDRLASTFLVTHHVAGSPPRSGSVSLDVYRRLLPGHYRLEIRVMDARGTVLLREDRDLDVPEKTEEAPFPAGYSGDFNRLTGRELVHLTTLPSVELLPPGGDLLTGKAWIRAVTSGGPIGAVELYRDGELLVRDSEAPYVQQLEIPAQSHVFQAVALDPQDRALDRAQQVVRREGLPFRVRLQPSGDIQEGRQNVAAEVSVPSGETLASVSFYLNDRLLAEVRSAPWICSVPGPPYVSVLFVRAVALLASGEETEDLLFLTRLPAERVDVRLAALFVSVLDPKGQPVTDLAQDELRVFENGVERPVRSLNTVENLPLSVAVLLDTSSSMGRRLHLAANSAQRFFEKILRHSDQASLLTFSNDLRQRVPFTHDVELLAQGALGMRAFGTTRLHDAIVFSAAAFYGLGNRRALVVLSDGADNGSDYPFDQVLEAALKARALVFPVALGQLGESTDKQLETLARETGGLPFHADDISLLDQIYQEIATLLRTQYQVVYEPAPDHDMEALPTIEIKVGRPALTTRIVRGN